MYTKNLKILFQQDEIQTKIKEIAEKINNDYKGEELCIICVLKGAAIFCMDLIKHLQLPLTLDFIKISTYEGTNSTGKVNNLDLNLPSLENKNVIIVDDIVDTGFTADFLMKTIKSKNNTKSVKFAALSNKKVRRAIDFEPDYYGFEVDDKYLVGYGYDNNQYDRNLPFIGYIEV